MARRRNPAEFALSLRGVIFRDEATSRLAAVALPATGLLRVARNDRPFMQVAFETP